MVHQWDPLGHFWKFARNPRSPLGILGIHWESTGKGGSVISTDEIPCVTSNGHTLKMTNREGSRVMVQD